MKVKIFIILFILTSKTTWSQTPKYDQTKEGFLVFHPIKTDEKGKIIPWYSADLGESYSHTIKLVWDFWQKMRTDFNGLPYYMNHQVWRPIPNDPRGVGGDQLAMALSSWQLLYQYTGDENVRENMKFIADYYISHGFSAPNAAWPNIPFPYNTFTYSGIYDGDMTEGKNITQPDKAGSFGYELVQLYKLTTRDQWQTSQNKRYLQAAIDIANTLALKTKIGDNENSPMPFKINVLTNKVANLKNNGGNGEIITKSSYTTNWVGTLQLFEALIDMKTGNITQYKKAHKLILDWMKKYPLRTNKWGPFFEDIEGWSDTQINAVTFARYMMESPPKFPDWKVEVKGIFDWVYQKLGNKQWEKYGVTVINEQTAYETPGNSHSSRQAAAELLYASVSRDNTYTENAIRVLNWATYMVDVDGKNNYPRDEVWLTDGYGDYIRHYLRAMATMPELAPADEIHILHASNVLSEVDYKGNFNKTLAVELPNLDRNKPVLYYRCSKKEGTETIRMPQKPNTILLGKNELSEMQNLDKEGFTWQKMEKGGLLKIRHSSGKAVTVFE